MASSSAAGESAVRAQNGLRKSQVASLLRQLRAQRAEILEKLSAPAGRVGTHADPSDEAKSQESIHLDDCTRNVSRDALKRVDEAIARISAGAFGKCFGPERDLDKEEECNGKIIFAQLKRCPTLELCQHCAKEQIARGNKKGTMPVRAVSPGAER